MSRQRALRAVPIAAAAMAGVLLGHWLAYLTALPRAAQRTSILAATGHGYWTEAVRIAVAFGASGLAALVAVHLGRGDEGDPDGDRVSSILLRLGAIQCIAFLAMESIERIAAHVPVTTVLQGHVLVLGLAFQILVACIGALVLRWLHRAVAGLVAILHRPSLRPAPAHLARPHRAPYLLRSVLAGASGVRGPPLR